MIIDGERNMKSKLLSVSVVLSSLCIFAVEACESGQTDSYYRPSVSKNSSQIDPTELKSTTISVSPDGEEKSLFDLPDTEEDSRTTSPEVKEEPSRDEEIVKFQDELTKARKRIAELEEELDLSKKKIDALLQTSVSDSEKEELKAQLSQAKSEKAELVIQLTELKANLARKESRLQQLQKLEQYSNSTAIPDDLYADETALHINGNEFGKHLKRLLKAKKVNGAGIKDLLNDLSTVDLQRRIVTTSVESLVNYIGKILYSNPKERSLSDYLQLLKAIVLAMENGKHNEMLPIAQTIAREMLLNSKIL